jgi:hypothetical protein
MRKLLLTLVFCLGNSAFASEYVFNLTVSDDSVFKIDCFKDVCIVKRGEKVISWFNCSDNDIVKCRTRALDVVESEIEKTK